MLRGRLPAVWNSLSLLIFVKLVSIVRMNKVSKKKEGDNMGRKKKR